MRRNPFWIDAALVIVGGIFIVVGVASTANNSTVGLVGALGGVLILGGEVSAIVRQRRSGS